MPLGDTLLFDGVKLLGTDKKVEPERTVFNLNTNIKAITHEAFIDAGMIIRAKNQTFVVPEPEDSKCIVLRNADSEIRFAGTLSAPVVVPTYAYTSDPEGRGRHSPFVAHYEGEVPQFQMYALAREIVALDYELKIYPRCYSRHFVRNICVRKTRGSLVHNVSENEQVAIETLREIISESEFRKYINYGFISVRGRSGLVYQIFRNQSHTKVWRGNKLIEEICVRIKNVNIPLTDNVIAFKAIIEADEEGFRKMGNLYKMAA